MKNIIPIHNSGHTCHQQHAGPSAPHTCKPVHVCVYDEAHAVKESDSHVSVSRLNLLIFSCSSNLVCSKPPWVGVSLLCVSARFLSNARAAVQVCLSLALYCA
jgi:hypothetical protein